jgi:hypothetical protein
MRATGYLAWGLMMLGLAGEALAAPLDKAVCDSLKEEHGQLVLAGAKDNMARGPEWATANLAPDKIKEIKRLIDVEEQLAFRCPQPKPPAQRAESLEPAASGADAPSASEQPTGSNSPKAARTATRKAKIRAAAKDAARSRGKRAKKAAPRPKANDAYMPPPNASTLAPPVTLAPLGQ